jgi:hypothetical protein
MSASRDTSCVKGRSVHGWFFDNATFHWRCQYCRQWRKPQPDKIMAKTWKPPKKRSAPSWS